MAVQVKTLLSDTGVSLLMDPGSGTAVISADSDTPTDQWRLFTFQLPMRSTGTARFGLQVFSKDPSAHAATVIEIAARVVAPIGHEWTRL